MHNDKKYSASELIKRFLPYYKKHKLVVVLDLFCASLTTVCELILPLILKYITNAAVNDIASITVAVILKLGAIYLILRIIACVANYYMSYQGHVMGTKMETDMRKDAYDHLLKLSDTFYNNTKVGTLMSRITSDLFDVTEFAHHCPEEFFIAGIKIIVSFVILLTFSIPLTLMVFVLIPILCFVSVKLNRRNRQGFADQRVAIGELNASIEDSLLGQKVVKAFANEDIEREKFKEGNQKFYEVKKKTYRYMATFHTSTRMFDGLMYLVVLVGGGLLLINGFIDSGDLVAYILYIATLIESIRMIIEFSEQFLRGITGIERFLQILDSDIEIFDEPDAAEMPKPQGKIEFKNVSFEYSDDANKIFSNLNLVINPGEKLAIVGPSGSGKTTLCNLIPRFYDINEGEILIDGENTKKYTLKSLRRNIGIVQQDVYLFSGTVIENILYGRPDATREDAIEAAKKAGADEFITNLKNGYDTYVGERGVKLSGGQKQRISIARVFLKNPSVMILDEATSALDNESEFEVAMSLKKLSEGRTTITIAHRLSSIKNSDRIIVLTEDGIVEEGNHESLMAKKGLYCDYYTMADKLK